MGHLSLPLAFTALGQIDNFKANRLRTGELQNKLLYVNYGKREFIPDFLF